jgi:hypothetical protein
VRGLAVDHPSTVKNVVACSPARVAITGRRALGLF